MDGPFQDKAPKRFKSSQRVTIGSIKVIRQHVKWFKHSYTVFSWHNMCGINMFLTKRESQGYLQTGRSFLHLPIR